MDKVRYQNQPWYMKVYLNIKHELPVPYHAIKMWLKIRKKPIVCEDGLYFPNSFKFCWSLSKGIADCDKGHYYTSEEVFGRLREKINGNKSSTKSKDGR
jgi:hypothetical protein